MIAQKVANYEISDTLGAGPLGAVYKAWDRAQGRHVALRVMSPEVVRWDAALRTRFLHEGRAISALEHPNIAEWYEVGEDGESMYIAAEWVDGCDLRTLIAERAALPIEKRVAVMQQVAAALAYAHDAGILHRDIRPANIFLRTDGIAKVADFGLASMTSGALLKPALRWGSPLYLCPEQIRHKFYDPRSEVFAAGTVFYEFLTGIHPFQHSNSNRALDDILSEEHLPSFEPLSEAPAGLCSLLASCLAKDPGERFAGMSELAGALADLLDDIAKECQAMVVELQIATHRLKRAAAVREAPPEIEELGRSIRQLLGSDHRRDYASLDALMAALAEQSAVIHVLTKGPARRQSAMRPPAVARQEIGAPDGRFAADRSRGQAAIAEILPPPEADLGERVHVPEAATVPAGEGRRESLEPLDAGELEYLNVMMAEIGEARTVDAPDPAPVPASAPQDVPPMAQCHELALCPVVVPVAPPRCRRIPKRVVAAVVAVAALSVAAAVVWPRRAALWDLVQSSVSRAGIAATPTSAQPKTPAESVENKDAAPFEPATGVLLREAGLMLEQGRPEASRVFLQRALALEPGNQAARVLLAELDAKPPVLPVVEDRFQEQVAAVTGLIGAGQLRKARTEINRLAAADPDHPALGGLRKSLEAKAAGASRRDTERKMAEQAEVERRVLAADENWSRRANDLFRTGRYSELTRVFEQWGQESPASSRLPGLRAQAAQLQQVLGFYHSALSDKRYTDAAVALARAEALNPADPAWPELRRLLESRRTSATARLTVLRLAEPGVVLLDAVPVGHGGEVQSAPVAIGEHVVSVKLPGVVALTATHDFSEGENASFVYDGSSLRPGTSSDLEAASLRKAREQTHSFAVEHTHGMLRGNCKGELLVNGFEVGFKPETGSHGFEIPFARLKMRTEGRVIELRFASDNAAFHSFRMREADEAKKLNQLWARLQR